jgi:phage baseplate assembly protein W
MDLNQIKSADWSLSLTTPGAVVEGDADISQCIFIILSTEKGSDPLRPEFGTNIFRFIDAPVNVAAANIVREIIEGVGLWEPRVEVKTVVYAVEDSRLKFTVNWERIGSRVTGQTELALGVV